MKKEFFATHELKIETKKKRYFLKWFMIFNFILIPVILGSFLYQWNSNSVDDFLSNEDPRKIVFRHSNFLMYFFYFDIVLLVVYSFFCFKGGEKNKSIKIVIASLIVFFFLLLFHIKMDPLFRLSGW